MSDLFLNKKVYSLEMINKASHAYKELADINYTNNEQYHILSFKNCQYDELLTAREYENYVIDLMVSRNGK